ncbi:MAG: hypothetical protein QXS07_00190 [Candidatus Pacearchaeota archaeon]
MKELKIYYQLRLKFVHKILKSHKVLSSMSITYLVEKELEFESLEEACKYAEELAKKHGRKIKVYELRFVKEYAPQAPPVEEIKEIEKEKLPEKPAIPSIEEKLYQIKEKLLKEYEYVEGPKKEILEKLTANVDDFLRPIYETCESITTSVIEEVLKNMAADGMLEFGSEGQ